jgi:hypothetical protein
LKTGYFQLHLYNEDLSEKHLYQNNAPNSSPWNWGDYNLELHNKAHTNAPWVKVFKPVEHTIRWNNETTMTWGEPINLSSMFTIDEAAIRPRRGASLTATTIDEASQFLGGLNVVEVNRPSRTITVSHADHVRSHQEMLNTQALAASMQLQHESEMARRAAQRETDRRRQEEERNRQRRPWERVRNFFGRD